jgi:hypothetical protein
MSWYVEVVAVPKREPPTRAGARFALKPGEPLRVGPSHQARLRLPSMQGGLAFELTAGGVELQVGYGTARVSLGGRALTPESHWPLAPYDCVYLGEGLVLRFDEGARRSARHAALEETLARTPDDEATWRVYMDFLEEQGDVLADWLRHPTTEVGERHRRLGALAESVRTGALTVEYAPSGLSARASLTRQGVEGTPGLFWHLEQLAREPLFRFVQRLDVDYFVSHAPAEVDVAFDSPRARLEGVLDALAQAPFAPSLRTLNLGLSASMSLPPESPALARLLARAPRLEGGAAGLVRVGARAQLELLRAPEGVVVMGSKPGERLRLPPSPVVMGAEARCAVRVVGPQVADRLCVLSRTAEGQWVAHLPERDPFRDEAMSTLKVNERPTVRAVLHAADVLEPFPGLVFRFVPE